MTTLLKRLYIGTPKTIGNKAAVHPMEREWTSAIFKEPVEGPIWLGKTSLVGDGQADLKHHGGPEKAVFAYPDEHYQYWQSELAKQNITSGGMGENFLMENVMEDMISIGDTFEIGEAIVQVSQPRQPCWKPARRFNIKNLALLLQNTGKTGWYFRVLKEGFVEEGQSFHLVDRPYPYWTIEKCNQIMHHERDNLVEARELANCELLAINWQATLKNRVEKGEISDIRNRVFGPNE